MQDGKERLVLPGDRLATAEEFRPGRNTYEEDGAIFAASAGILETVEGAIGVRPTMREIKTIDKHMYVIGRVTDDMKSVIFVKLDKVESKRGEFLALKDGKIVLPKPRPGDDGGGRFRDRGDGPRGQQGRPPRTQERMCGVGDTIIAKVQFNDKDSYALSMNEPETGVVHALCDECGSDVEYLSKENRLVCRACGRSSVKKVSTLFNNPQGIKNLLAQ